MTESDPLAHADAVYVLGGTRIERAVEAADLYREGVAPHILISNGGLEPAQLALEARGIVVPNTAQAARTLLVDHLQVPPEAVEALDQFADNSAGELRQIAPLVAARGYASLIVITNRSSTHRIAMEARRVLGPKVIVIAWASRRDGFDAWRWWRTRDGVKQVFYEVPKLAAYTIHLAD